MSTQVTRRGFLKGAGVTAAGAMIADAGFAALAESSAGTGPRSSARET